MKKTIEFLKPIIRCPTMF